MLSIFQPRRYKPDAFGHKIFLDLITVGFTVLTDIERDFDFDLYRRTAKAWENWFDDGGDEDWKRDQATQSGWFSIRDSEKASGRKEVDYKEYFHYFPRTGAPPGLEGVTRKHFDQMQRFARIFHDLLMEDQPRYVDFSPKGTNNLLRILHYPPVPSGVFDDETIDTRITRAAPHTDINLLTFIPAPTEKGLQVLDDHGYWHDVPVDEKYMIVNVGDALQLSSKNLFRSVKHRVLFDVSKTSGKSRMSLPFFLHADPDAYLTPEITAQQHLEQRLKELGVS